MIYRSIRADHVHSIPFLSCGRTCDINNEDIKVLSISLKHFDFAYKRDSDKTNIYPSLKICNTLSSISSNDEVSVAVQLYSSAVQLYDSNVHLLQVVGKSSSGNSNEDAVYRIYLCLSLVDSGTPQGATETTT